MKEIFTPEEIAGLIQKGSNDQLEKILLATPEVANRKTAQGISFLQFAVYCGNKKAIDLLRQRKSDIDIFEASGLGELSTVKARIESDTHLVNTFSVDGFTPLGLSCFFGHFAVAKYLIEKGADVNIPSNNPLKVAPLHSACAISNFEIAELLLQSGANVNAKQASDFTPLHEAAHNGQTRLAELLIEKGADLNAKVTTGQTPLEMAVEKSFPETADLIRRHGGK